jgi:hypothetical protein
MPAMRLVAITDDAGFPYAEAKRRLAQDADLTPADLTPMIAAGRRMGWTGELIRANEELARRGNCFDFALQVAPYLTGTLYEDNVFFRMTGDESAEVAYVEKLAEELGAAVYRH